LQPAVGSSVAVFGVGSVGMSAIMAASLTPATKIIAVDVKDSRLAFARQYGATHTLNPSTCDVVKEIQALTDGFGVENALDATGNISVIQTMLECGSPGSELVTVGAPAKGAKVAIEPLSWLQQGASYFGAHQGSAHPKKVRLAMLRMQGQNGLLRLAVHPHTHRTLEVWKIPDPSARTQLQRRRLPSGPRGLEERRVS
jgi:aryl-alcohol dehydrogenase